MRRSGVNNSYDATEAAEMEARARAAAPDTRWTVIVGRVALGRHRVCVRCACGTEREIRKDGLVGGTTRSCGCLSREQALINVQIAHQTPRTIIPPEVRFWRKVVGGDVDECWEWQGQRNKGYGEFYVGIIEGRGTMTRAHRWAYEALRAEIPDGLFLDHLCRNPPCVNPWHLEPVTNAENVRRGLAPQLARARAALITHCKHGHEFTPENTRFDGNPSGGVSRTCRACRRNRWRAKYAPHLLEGEAS